MHSTRPPVVVFGECLVDWFEGRAVPGGAPCNVARHLAALGLDPLFITRVGADANGALLRAELTRYGVRSASIQVDPDRPTGQVTVHQRPGGHEFEILADQAYDYIEPIEAAALAPSGHTPWLYFGCLAQRAALSRRTLALMRALVAHRAFVDLNWRAGQVSQQIAQSTLDCADELKVSAEELGLLLEWAGLESQFTRHRPQVGARCPGVAALLQDRRTMRLAVTHGVHGYALWDRAGRCRCSGAGTAPAPLVDTVGAGDAFSAIVLAGRVLDWPDEIALARANEFAGAICGLQGAVPADPGFYAPWRRRWGAGGSRSNTGSEHGR
jgi:fructokinase